MFWFSHPVLGAAKLVATVTRAAAHELMMETGMLGGSCEGGTRSRWAVATAEWMRLLCSQTGGGSRHGCGQRTVRFRLCATRPSPNRRDP